MNTINYENDFSVLKQKYQALEAQNELIVSEMQNAVKQVNREKQYLNCLHNINIILSDMESDIIDVFQYIINELKSGLYSENTLVQIETDEYKTDDFEVTDDFSILSEKILINNNNWGEIKIAFPAVLASDFLFNRNNEIGFLRLISSSIGFYLEKRYKYKSVITEKENQYKNIFQNKHSIMFLLDPETGEIKDVNQAACDFYGWTHQEMCSKKIFDINPISELDMKAEMAKARQEKRSYFNFTHRLANGELRDVEVYSGPIIFNNKNLLYSIIHDITDRKNMEFKILRSEEKYRNIVESINDVVYEITKDGFITFVSPSVFKVLGYAEDEVLGKNIISYIYEEDRPMIIQRLNSINVKDYLFLEYRYVKKDGSTGWVRSSTNAITKEGVIIGGRGTLTDITERKNIEEALKISEDKFSKAFKTSPYASTITTLDGKIIEVNEAFVRISGYSKEETLQNTILGLNIWVDEEKRNIFTQSLKDGKDVINLESSFRIKNGEIHTALLSASFIDIDDKTYILSKINDITEQKKAEAELKQSEELYRAVINASPDNITISDLEGKIIMTSPKAVSMFGYENINQILNRNIAEFLTPQSFEKAQIEIAKMYEGYTAVPDEYKAIKQNGDVFDIEVNADLIRDDEGNPVRMIIIIRDITDRKIAEEKLRLSEEKYRNFFENVQDIYYETSPEGIITEMSPSIFTLSQGMYTREDMLNKSLIDLYANPDDRNKLLDLLLKNGKVTDYEIKLKIKDDSEKYISISSNIAISTEGKVEKIYGSIRDISKRKIAEEKLTERNEEIALANYQLTMAQQIGHSGFWSYNMKTGEMKGSAESLKLFGFEKKPDDFTRENIENCISELERVKQASYNLIERKIPYNIVYEIQPADGSSFRIITSKAELQYDKEGNPVEMFGVFQDNTERKKAEEVIRASEERFRAISEYSFSSICILNAAGKVIWINEAMLKTSGYTSEQAYNAESFTAFIHPESLEFVVGNFFKFVNNEKYEHNYQFWLIKADGEKRLFEKYMTHYTDQDGNRNLIISMMDVTERIAAEKGMQKLSQAIDQSLVMTYITDTTGTIEYVNPRVVEISGYKNEELIGQNPRIFSSGEKSTEEYAKLWETITSGNEWKGEFHNKKKNGELYWVMASISPVINSEGIITNYIAVEEDITSRKLAEVKIKHQNEKLNAIINAIPDLIFIIDSNGTYLDFYSSDTNTILPANQIIGSNLAALFDEKSTQLHLQKIKECIENKTLINYNYSLAQKDIIKHYDARMTPFDIDKVLASVRDITAQKEIESEIRDLNQNLEQRIEKRTSELAESNIKLKMEIDNRKLTEQLLAEEKQRLADIIEGTNVGTWEWNVQSGETMFDERWANIIGYTIEELYPVNIDTWLRFVHPDDMKTSGELLEKHFKGETDYYAMESRMKHKNGKWIWILDRGKVHKWDVEGKPLLMSGTHQDITERKAIEQAIIESEIKHSSMISNISDVIGIMGADGIMKYKSPNIERYFGWKPEDLVDADGSITIHPDDLERIQTEFYHLFQADNSSKTVEYRYKCKNGNYKPIELTAVNLINNTVINGVLLNYRDISERKNAELIIEQTRVNYETFFNTIDDFLFVLDERGNMIHVNSTVINRLEYSFNELIGKSVLIVHPEERREEAARIVGEMLAGTADFCPVPLVTKSGHYISVETRVKAGYWNEKPVIFGVTKDISKIKLSEEKFSKAFQTNSALMAISNFDDAVLIDVNNLFIKSLGFEREEVIGKTTSELNLFVDKRIRNLLIEELKQKQSIKDKEIEVRTKDGRILTGLFSADVIYVGKDKCMLTVMHDITERKAMEKALKESEARWNFALEGSASGVWDWNAQTGELYLSSQWKKILGFNENDAEVANPVFETWKNRVHPDDIKKSLVYLNKHLKGNTSVYIHEYRMMRKDGSYIWLLDRGKIIEKDENKNPLRVIGTITDISDRKKFELTLKQSIEREKELSDLKSRFVSMASHEFRTPLAAILMYSDILISYWEKMDTIQIFDNLKVIKDQVSHLSAVVADVMQISKIQEGRVNFNPQKTDIISLCKNTLLTFNSDIKLVNKINFKSDIKEAIVKIDIRLIQQVLNNLISNAIKYNDNNPVISLKITANETALHISIKDNGIGIPEEDMKHLFEAFFRAKNVKNIQGNGLGLNIVKEAMKLHGGSVIVESKVKKGSVFTLIFPMKIIVSCK